MLILMRQLDLANATCGSFFNNDVFVWAWCCLSWLLMSFDDDFDDDLADDIVIDVGVGKLALHMLMLRLTVLWLKLAIFVLMILVKSMALLKNDEKLYWNLWFSSEILKLNIKVMWYIYNHFKPLFFKWIQHFSDTQKHVKKK